MQDIKTLSLRNQKKNKLHRLLRIPKLESMIENNIMKIKRPMSSFILAGILISTFGMSMQFRYFLNQTSILNSGGKIFNSTLECFLRLALSIIFQYMYSFMIDINSFNSSMILGELLFLISSIISFVSWKFEFIQLVVFANQITYVAQSCLILSLKIILYDSSYDLQRRFNKSLLVLSLGVLPLFTYKLLNFYEQPEFLNRLQISIIGASTISIGAIIIYFTYGQIEIQRNRSPIYQQYLRYQGIALSFTSIFNYYCQQDVVFCLIVSFTTQFLTHNPCQDLFTTLLNQKQNNPSFENIIEVTYTLTLFIPGMLIVLYANSNQNILQKSIELTRYFMSIQLVIQPFLCAFIYYQEYFSYNTCFIVYLIVVSFKGSINILSYYQFFEIMSCLNHQRSVMKGQGLALISIFQELPKFIYYSPISPFSNHLLQLLLLIITRIYLESYLKKRSFNKLESKLKSYLQKEELSYLRILQKNKNFQTISDQETV